MLSFEQIKELVELVARHRLGGLELERSGFKLSIAAQPVADGASPGAAAVRSAGAAGAGSAPAAAPAPVPAAAAPATAPPPVQSGPPAGASVLTSPIVGTFYAAPAPDAEPFVRVGDRVRAGQVLCIIEAMKLMNEIESDADGTIVEIYPKNAQPVEFGEPLFAIRPE